MGIPNLPIDVLRVLAPVLPVLRTQVHDAVVSVEQPRLERKGRAAARAAGDGKYLSGHMAVIEAVFGGTPDLRADGESYDGDADDDDDACDCGECDCETCNPDSAPYSCCGYCPRCDNCHGGHDSYYTRSVGNGRYCRECDHECET